MKWAEIIKDYLSFNRKERIAVTTLVVLIVLVFFLPRFIPREPPPLQPGDMAKLNSLKSLENQPGTSAAADETEHFSYPVDRMHEPATSQEINFFYFNPNRITEEEWKTLGLRDKTIRTIRNYLAKGGRFRKPSDLQKIYGLQPAEYEKLSPYIRIEEDGTQASNKFEKRVYTHQPALPTHPFRTAEINDINTADTSAFIALPGIGGKLAARIIAFRDRLGGFYAVSQIAETYGLPDSVFQTIKPYLHLSTGVFRKININTATLEELKAHPYIRYSIARPLLAYRDQHGAFKQLSDIEEVEVITGEIFKKIAPYLVIEHP